MSSIPVALMVMDVHAYHAGNAAAPASGAPETQRRGHGAPVQLARTLVANRRVSTVQHGRWSMVDPIVFLTLLV
jgi:hypothetical protein